MLTKTQVVFVLDSQVIFYLFGQPGHFLSFWTARSFFHVILSGTFLGVAGNDHID
jgi:hypothetical protein